MHGWRSTVTRRPSVQTDVADVSSVDSKKIAHPIKKSPTARSASGASMSPSGERFRRDHLAAMRPSYESMEENPRNGELIASTKLLAAGDMMQNGQRAEETNEIEAFLFGKRRGNYIAHQGAAKCQRSKCLGVGISMVEMLSSKLVLT